MENDYSSGGGGGRPTTIYEYTSEGTPLGNYTITNDKQINGKDGKIYIVRPGYGGSSGTATTGTFLVAE